MKITDVSVSPSGFRYWLPSLVVCHVITSCISLIFVAEYYRRLLPLADSVSHVLGAAVTAAPFALLSIFFMIRPFNFGYALGFYLFTLIMDYLWLLELSTFQYDHRTAAYQPLLRGSCFSFPRCC